MPRRTFADMTPEEHRAIASAGGRARAAKGVGHRFTHEEAQAAGRKGGTVVSRDREYMSDLGHKSAMKRWGKHDAGT